MQKYQHPSDTDSFLSENYPFSAIIPQDSDPNKVKLLHSENVNSVNSKNKLLQRINQGLPVGFWKEFNLLISKSNLERLTESESYRLRELGNEIESTNNKRLELAIKLSKLKGQQIEDLIADFRLIDVETIKKGCSNETIKEVKERSKGLCEFCQSQIAFSFTAYSIRLFTSRTKFGKATSSNLVHSCRGCNNHRYLKTKGFDPVSGSNTHIFNPTKDNWNEHFFWSDDFIYLIGKTCIGRATIEELSLNRETLVKHRKILVSIQKHPLFLF